ncbi:MAG: Rpn family recombination-promoting nuclease/putative transposase [Legionella sp.]|nr:Rpn family recombination-promoting nuclease/putative transposase [Legionella sp.]
MKKNTKNKIINPHDQFFRTALANPRVARDFLKAWLPKDLCERIDFEKLEIQPRSYINDVRQESEVDVLFKTKIDDKEAYLYFLLEHQSKPDPLMPFRLFKYLCNIMDDHLKTQQTKKLPLVYPLVIYHGKQKYPFSTNIHDLVDAPPELIDRFFLKPFHLIDLGCIEDETLKKHAWAGVMEFALKHIFSRDILPFLKNMTGLMHELDRSGGRDFLAIVLQYIIERGEISDKDEFFNLIDTKISPEVGEQIMSLAKELKEEGRLEGRLEGELNKEREIAKRLLKEESDPAFILKVTGLSLEEIKELDKH